MDSLVCLDGALRNSEMLMLYLTKQKIEKEQNDIFLSNLCKFMSNSLFSSFIHFNIHLDHYLQ
jgi:hypothetical protein